MNYYVDTASNKTSPIENRDEGSLNYSSHLPGLQLKCSRVSLSAQAWLTTCVYTLIANLVTKQPRFDDKI